MIARLVRYSNVFYLEVVPLGLITMPIELGTILHGGEKKLNRVAQLVARANGWFCATGGKPT